VPKELITFALGVAFAAGIFYAREARTRKDLNGVRRLLNNHVEKTRERFVHTIIVLMLMNEGKDFKTVLDLLRRDVN
jgi:hypothetical protein